MKNLTQKVYQYGIYRINLKEKNITLKALSKYKAFCKDVVLKKPDASFLYLCTAAFLALQFYVDYPKLDLPPVNFMSYE